MKFFLILNIMYLTIKPNEFKFTNYVEYPNDANLNEYTFDLVITHGLAMAIRNDLKRTYDPVVYNLKEGIFYQNNKSTSNCDYNFKVTNMSEQDSISTVLGLHKEMLFINYQFPGPSMVVPLNSIVRVNVHNHMISTILSMHWHGQVQNKTFYHDGVTHVTQCPISPGESYTYKFKAENLGTHWYHAHSGLQRTDGVYGAFIVYDAKSKLNYDKEFYLLVQDFSHRLTEELFKFPLWKNFKFNQGYSNAKCDMLLRMDDGTTLPFVPPEAVVLNGKGWHNITKNISEIINNGDELLKLPLETFEVEPNKKYLFRIVGANMAFPLQIYFVAHKIKVIASDGNRMEPIENVDSLIINGGERYDIELQTNNGSESNVYFIFVKIMTFMNEKYEELSQEYFGLGVLKYKTSAINKISYDFLNCSSAYPCTAVNCPFKMGRNKRINCINVDKFRSINENVSQFDKDALFKTEYKPNEFNEYFINFHFSGTPETRSSINGKQFIHPKMPLFFPLDYKDALYKCDESCIEKGFCACSNVLEIPKNRVIQFTFYHMQQRTGSNHPIHLHGHHFYIVSYNYPDYDVNGTFLSNNKDINCTKSGGFCNEVGWSDPTHYNGNIPNGILKNPVLKDTVLVPAGGYVTVRFYSNNIGYWVIHCHIENHHAEGMQLIIKEGDSEDIRSLVEFDDITTCSKGFTVKSQPSKNEKFVFEVLFYIFLALLVGVCLILLLTIVKLNQMKHKILTSDLKSIVPPDGYNSNRPSIISLSDVNSNLSIIRTRNFGKDNEIRF